MRVTEQSFAPQLGMGGIRCNYTRHVLEDMYYTVCWKILREVKKNIILSCYLLNISWPRFGILHQMLMKCGLLSATIRSISYFLSSSRSVASSSVSPLYTCSLYTWYPDSYSWHQTLRNPHYHLLWDCVCRPGWLLSEKQWKLTRRE